MKKIPKIIIKSPNKKAAKIMEVLVNDAWDDWGDVIQEISHLRMYFDNAYGIKTEQELWNPLMKHIVKMKMNLIKKYENPFKKK